MSRGKVPGIKGATRIAPECGVGDDVKKTGHLERPWGGIC